MPVRTFLAIDIDEHIRKGLLEVEGMLASREAKVRWVAGENLHITLNFLGSVPDDTMAAVCDIAAEVASGIEPFEFDVRGVICVPPQGPLRMIWADVIDPTGRMARLQKNLAAALSGLGLKEEERGFKPHITLGRVKFTKNPAALRAAAAPRADEDFGSHVADEVIAYSSVLTPEGSIYTPVARVPLGGG